MNGFKAIKNPSFSEKLSFQTHNSYGFELYRKYQADINKLWFVSIFIIISFLLDLFDKKICLWKINHFINHYIWMQINLKSLDFQCMKMTQITIFLS